MAQDRLAWLGRMLDGHEFVVGDRFTIADIWLYAWLNFANFVGQPFGRALPCIAPWFARAATHFSAASSLHPDCKPGGVRG